MSKSLSIDGRVEVLRSEIASDNPYTLEPSNSGLSVDWGDGRVDSLGGANPKFEVLSANYVVQEIIPFDLTNPVRVLDISVPSRIATYRYSLGRIIGSYTPSSQPSQLTITSSAVRNSFGTIISSFTAVYSWNGARASIFSIRSLSDYAYQLEVFDISTRVFTDKDSITRVGAFDPKFTGEGDLCQLIVNHVDGTTTNYQNIPCSATIEIIEDCLFDGCSDLLNDVITLARELNK